MFHAYPWPWFGAPIAVDPASNVMGAVPMFVVTAEAFDDSDDADAGHLISAVRNAAPVASRRPRRHPGVEFAVNDAHRTENIFRTFDDAAAFAVRLAGSNGARVNLDVLVHSPAGARWWGGDDAVAAYHEDPDASVFERIEIRADTLGRVP